MNLRILPIFLLVTIQCLIVPLCAEYVEGFEVAAEEYSEEMKKKKLEDDVIKYAEILQCQMCEVALETLTVMEYKDRDQNKHIDSAKEDKYQRALHETRNYEVVEGLCEKMKNDALKAKDKGSLGMIQLHCARIIEEKGATFVKYLSKLQNENRPLVLRKPKPKGPSRMHKEAAKGSSTDKVNPLMYSNEEEVEEMCESLCPVKSSIKASMNRAKESVKMQHDTYEMRMRAFFHVFKQALSIIAGYWYLALGGFVTLTVLLTWIQWKLLLRAKRNELMRNARVRKDD
eukprot:Tbor_TRINITY_DN5883_c1_g2::TRINITY_DN5883_c1_g2_i1::g.6502::m.6502